MDQLELLDDLNYRSWWYQVNWYGMSRESARKLYKDWKIYEEKEKQDESPRVA